MIFGLKRVKKGGKITAFAILYKKNLKAVKIPLFMTPTRGVGDTHTLCKKAPRDPVLPRTHPIDLPVPIYFQTLLSNVNADDSNPYSQTIHADIPNHFHTLHTRKAFIL